MATLPTYGETLNPPTLRLAVMQFLSSYLKVVSALGTFPAFLWFGFVAVREARTWAIRPITVWALAIGSTILARVGMLAVLDATSIPLESRYLTPAFAPDLLLVTLFLVDVAPRLPHWVMRTRRNYQKQAVLF